MTDAAPRARPAMRLTWRIVLGLAVLGIVGPALAALAIAGWGALMGCAPEAPSCGGLDLGASLAFALEWAWKRILDVPGLAILVAIAAVAAAFGFAPRGRAVTWSFMTACWGCIAALILPFVAVFSAMPEGCRITEAGAAGCIVWGHKMGMAYEAAGAAFWWSIVIVPVSLGGVLLTFILASLRQRLARSG